MYPKGAQEWNDTSINNTSDEKWTSGIFKATKNGLRKELHLSIGRRAVKRSSKFNILQTEMLGTTLKTKRQICGNFVWLDMGLTKSLKEWNTLNASVFIQVRSLLSGYLNSFALNSSQSSGKNKK